MPSQWLATAEPQGVAWREVLAYCLLGCVFHARERVAFSVSHIRPLKATKVALLYARLRQAVQQRPGPLIGGGSHVAGAYTCMLPVRHVRPKQALELAGARTQCPF